VLRIALKGVLARKGRLLLTSIAVVAGCAFLSGVFVFSDTIRASFDRLFANAYENTDAFVRSSNVIEGDFVESRERLPDTVIAEVAAVSGVSSAEGDIMAFASIATTDGDNIGSSNGPPKYGGVFSDSDASPWDLAEGSPPSGPDQVVIDRQSAQDGDLAVGDQIDVTTAEDTRRVTVTGIATFAGSDTSGGATWALFDLPTAQEFVIGQPGRIDAVIVRGDGSVGDEELQRRIQEVFTGRDVEVLTGAEITEENQDAVEEGLSFFTIFLTIFAAISLFVGSFIIYNVFSISAAQRQKENALLRAIGASRAQVTRSLFVEALAVGAVGGLLGFAGGVGLAALILAALQATGFGIEDAPLTVKAGVLVTTMIVGILVTLVCAIVPALRAGRVPPLAAMRDVSVDRSDVSRARLVTGAVFAVVAIGGTAAGLSGDPAWLGLGIVGLFVSLVVLGPLFAGPIARLLTAPLARTRGVTGEIAGRNAATSPKRTALTAGALGIGLALLVGVSTLGSSIRSSIRETIGSQFRGDFAVSTGDDQGIGGLPIALSEQLNELPEVGDALGIGVSLVRIVEGGEPDEELVLTVDPQRAEGIYDLDFTEGGWAGLDAGSVLVDVDKAADEGWSVGSTVDVVLLDGTTQAVTVGGVFEGDGFGTVIVDRQLFAGQTTDLFDFQVLVSTADGVSEGEARAAISPVVERYPTADLKTRGEFIDDQSAQVDGFLNFIYALLLMSVFIAILGIVITLLLAVYERRRELGLVRAIGMTRPQVRSSIRWEAVITAIIGSIMGTALGLALGWIVVSALEDEGLNTFSVSPSSIGLFVVAAIVFAVVAAWIPARKAAKSDILQAIATT